MQEIEREAGVRIVIVGAGGYGRVVLDILTACGYRELVVGFYDDAHAVLPEEIKGVPVLGDVGMLKSMLSVEELYVVVAITENRARMRVANSLRGAGARFVSAVHPAAHVSLEAAVGDGAVICAGAVVHTDAALGSHCHVGPGAVVERDSVVGAGAWVSGGAVVGVRSHVGARVHLGANSTVGRKAEVRDDLRVPPLTNIVGEGE
ncbi:acetyltransferase [Rubrobacter taiwanensis]|uniref:Acetyltransferase n=1 Tax=Rubrobacter taiwanensis TaxID=185139 RepID=A0A4R1BIW2_9ACTN|nr:acetyltransferase [Rubrobacter taiwanensis]TCJ17275.1 acetyltransferase [Rubrobacter taiwanensis]